MDVSLTLSSGSMLIAIPLAAVAGLVSFASPCVLPLVPGYVSFMTGVVGASHTSRAPRRSRVLAGTLSFIAGVAVVFVSFGALFGGLGRQLLMHQREIQIAMGAVVIVLGLGFMGILPAVQRELRLHRAPRATVAGSFALGFLFALGWTPCIGPALAAVQSMALSEASALRGAVLGLAFCLGMGVPFAVLGMSMERGLRAVKWLRQHTVAIMRFGGALLVAIGVMQVTGYWNTVSVWLRIWGAGWQVLL